MYSNKYIQTNYESLKKKLRLRGVEEEQVTRALEHIEALKTLELHERLLNEQRNKFIAEDAKGNAENIRAIKVELHELISSIAKQKTLTKEAIDALPNIPDDSLTDKSELIKTWGDIEPKSGLINHHELAKQLSLLSFEEGVAISGSGFVVYKDLGARLYRALIEFTLESNRSKGYEERYLPVLLLPSSLYGTAQLPKFREDLFETIDGKFLSPTSESQLVNIYREKIIEGSKLPIKLTSNTNCFRREAGSAGVQDSGIIRLHQFSKTELVVFCKPEESFQILEEMVRDACSILEALKLPYRVIQLAYDDMGFASTKTYDIEVWLPSEGKYREISSVSNTLDFQAMRTKIRYKDKLLDKSEKAKYVHILNGSSLAIDRLFAAVVDNYQDSGSLNIPEALQKYLGIKKISN